MSSRCGPRGNLSWVRILLAGMLLGMLWLTTSPARAHEPSKSYLNLSLVSNQFTGQWDLPISELKGVIALDADHDGVITWEELRDRYPQMLTYARAHLQLSWEGQPVVLQFTTNEPTVEDFTDGAYLEVPFVVPCPANPARIEVDYRLFFETNALHRGMLRLEALGKVQSSVFSPQEHLQQFSLGTPSTAGQFRRFLGEGIGHIWTGYDHILFLLALLLPAVLCREGTKWVGATGFRPALLRVVKIVTAFTAAHSVTLSLATLEIVKLKPRLTESAIAFSVILAAANNLWPLVKERGWLVAFAFGLIHGFGFANALGELGLASGHLTLVLVGFNLGVELGQLAIVLAFLPLAYAGRKSWFYQIAVLRLGSAGIILIAGTWLAERVFNFKLLPF